MRPFQNLNFWHSQNQAASDDGFNDLNYAVSESSVQCGTLAVPSEMRGCRADGCLSKRGRILLRHPVSMSEAQLMITIHVNGEARDLTDGLSVADLLEELNINNRYCAVERNQQLVLRENHNECRLKDGDTIEVVTLVGGG